MQHEIIEAVRERYESNPKAIKRSQAAGTFELILVSLAQYDLLREIAESMKPYEDCHEK